MLLGVNIDHIAVLREARRSNLPQLIDTLPILQIAGADQVTIHLREDRRHIQDNDLFDIVRHSSLPVNLEMSIAPEIVDIALKARPHRATLVPEKREEVTTEGGLNLDIQEIRDAIRKLQDSEIEVSLFINPEIEGIEKAKELGANAVELHTGKFANIYAMLYGNLSKSHHAISELDLPRDELKKLLEDEIFSLEAAAKTAREVGLYLAGGHGLNYQNIKLFTEKIDVDEVNIGQAIVARAVFVGLERAIKEMKELL